MRWRRIGTIGGGILALTVAGVAIFIATFDADAQKPRIAAAVKQATGRDLRLGGPIRLGWSLRPTLVLGDVAFSNPPGFSRPDMATVERVEVQLGLLPLLNHRIEIDRLTVVKPDVRLETDAQGQGNWVFVPASAAPANPAPPAGATPAGTKSEPLTVVVNAIRLENGLFAWRDGKTGHTSTLAAKEIATLTGSLDAPLHATASLTLDGTEADIALDAGPLAALSAGTAPFPVKLTVKANGASIGVEGSIAHPQTGEGIDLALTANIPDLAALSSLAHQDLPPVKAFVFSAKLTGNPKELALRDLKTTSSLGDLGGELTIAPAPRMRIGGTLASQKFDADGLIAPASVKPTPATPSAPGLPAPAAASKGLIPDTPLPVEPLRALDADLRVSVGALRLGGSDYKTIAGHLVLKDGVLDLDPAQADLPEGHVALSLHADAGKAEPVVHLKLEAPGIALQPLLVTLGQPAYATGSLEVRADLHGSGPSPHAIASSLDGYLGLAMPGGTVDLKRIGGAATAVTEALKPASGAGANVVRCFALRLDFAKGIGTVKALALGSALLNADGSGSVDLGNETLALNLRSRTVLGGTAITMPVRVSGPMARPQTKVDEVGIAQANAAALGSLLGGQAGAVLGAAKQPAGGGDVCPAAMAVARGQAAPAVTAEEAPAAAAPAPAAPQPKPPNAGQLLKQLFR